MSKLPELESLPEGEKVNLIHRLLAEVEQLQAERERTDKLHHIFRLWVRLKQKLYPSDCHGIEVRGILLDSLDQDVAGCVSTYLTTGELNERQWEALYYCKDCLETVTLELQGFAGWYFRQLKALASAIIEYEGRSVAAT